MCIGAGLGTPGGCSPCPCYGPWGGFACTRLVLEQQRKGGAALLILLAYKLVCVCECMSVCLCVCASVCVVCVRACSTCRILESARGSRIDEGRQSEAMSAYQPLGRVRTHMAVLHCNKRQALTQLQQHSDLNPKPSTLYPDATQQPKP